MHRHTFALLFLVIFTVASFSVAQDARPKNVIVVISDGTGHNHLKITNYWKHGADERLSFQSFPVKLSMTTLPSTVAPYDPTHIWLDPYALILSPTDSAAAGTAMSTGHKAKNGTISVSPMGGPLQTAMERAAASGKAVGVATTSSFYDATPSVFLAHSDYRRNYIEIIPHMLFSSPARVILGAGDLRYNKDALYEEYKRGLERIGGMQVWLDLLRVAQNGGPPAPEGFEPWTLIQRTEDFRALREGDTPSRVLGIARSGGPLNAERSGRDDNIADDMPYEVPRLTNVPTMADLALGAINVLDEESNGFFLMVETEGTDETAHDWYTGRLIEEVLELDATVAEIIRWVEQNSSWDETLLIVTADHETGKLTGPTVGRVWSEIMPVPAGVIAPHHWGTWGHSNLPVPLYAVGAGASGLTNFADEVDPRFGRCLRNNEFGEFLFSLFR